MSKIEEYLIQWNYQFPVDRWYRKKYNIGFLSPEHLELSQLDIAMEYLEDKIYEKFVDEIEDDKEKEKLYKSGRLFRTEEKITSQQELDLFNQLSPVKFSKIQFTNEE